jgi:hypothetical protein
VAGLEAGSARAGRAGGFGLKRFAIEVYTGIDAGAWWPGDIDAAYPRV